MPHLRRQSDRTSHWERSFARSVPGAGNSASRHLRATDDDLRNFLHQGQIGQMIFPNGKYDQTAYEDVAFRNGFTVPQFEEVLKQDILIQKLRDLVSASASVTDAEVKAQFEKQNTKVKFDYAFFKRDDILK